MADQAASSMTGLPPRLPQPEMSEHETFTAFVGGWQLALWTTFHKDGTADYPFGRDAVGQIMYSADGHMTCHLMRANRPLLDAPNIYDVTDEQLGAAMRAYTGYFGTFTIDAAQGVITHHVTGAWYPNWAGTDQPRRFAFIDDSLFLEAEVGDTLVRIEWRRVVTETAQKLA
jgi:hypothetical protein